MSYPTTEQLAAYRADLLRIDAEVGPPARKCAKAIHEAARAFLFECLEEGMCVREAGLLLEAILETASDETSKAVRRWE